MNKEDIAMKKVMNDIALRRKEYMKPTMHVVPLRHRSLILCGSPDATVLRGKAKTSTEDEKWYELQ